MASFLSILKVIGKGLGTILGIATDAAKIAQPFLPAGANAILGTIIAIVGRTEAAANQLSAIGVSIGGQGKLAIAEAIAGDFLGIAELISGKEIGDEVKYKRGIETIAAARKQILSGMSDVLDSLKPKD